MIEKAMRGLRSDQSRSPGHAEHEHLAAQVHSELERQLKADDLRVPIDLYTPLGLVAVKTRANNRLQK